jgi:hypothetical protein
MDKFILSQPRVRRFTAELVRKDLLRPQVSLNLLVTTRGVNVSEKCATKTKIQNYKFLYS